jgi:hypothetical protein
VAIADEGALAKLAGEPERELFPVLSRSAAMLPLVLFFAFVPGLVALRHHTLDEVGAAWGFRGLAVLKNVEGNVISEDLHSALSAEVDHLPPLGAWLIALSIRLFSSTREMALTIPSYFALAGAVVMAWVLINRAAGARLAFLTALIMAVHSPILLHARDPAPGALTLMCVLVVVWGFLWHRELDSGPVSFPLLIAGIGLGLCLLAAGSLAIVVLLVLALPILFETISNGHRQSPPRNWIERWSGGLSLAVLALTGFAAGGWWVLMMASHNGLEFWATWLGDVTIEAAHANGRNTPDASGLISTAFSVTGSLTGLALLGVWSIVRMANGSRCRSERDACEASSFETPNPPCDGSSSDDVQSQVHRSIGLLVSWTVVAVTVLIIETLSGKQSSLMAASWNSFAAFPVVVWAALGSDQVMRRGFGVFIVVALTLGTLLACAGAAYWQACRLDSVPLVTGGALATTVAAAILGCGWFAGRVCGDSDFRRRSMLAVCLVLLAVGHVVRGNARIQSDVEVRHEFWQLSSQLKHIGPVSHFSLVSDIQPSLRLRYIFASSCPRARSTVLTPGETDEMFERRAQVFDEGENTLGEPIVATWGDPTIALTSARRRGVLSGQIIDPVFFEGRAISVFGLTRRFR